MKMMIVVALALVAAAAAAPAAGPVPSGILEQVAQIIRSDFDQQPDGPYKYGFETSDGIKKEEEAQSKQVVDEENKPHTILEVRGQFTYINSFGEPETITYIADENGYRAEGKSIPKNASL